MASAAVVYARQARLPHRRTPLHAQAADPALLEALDARGLGVRTRVEREFYTQLVTLVVASTWTGMIGRTTCSAGAEASSSSGHANTDGPQPSEPSEPSEPSGLLEARRAALLAVFQENLVLRSRLVGKVVDCLVALRPGYLPANVVERVRHAEQHAGCSAPPCVRAVLS